jgi:hypothetical protein
VVVLCEAMEAGDAARFREDGSGGLGIVRGLRVLLTIVFGVASLVFGLREVSYS